MKKYCKRIDITNINFLKKCIFDCLDGGMHGRGKKKWRRRESIDLLMHYGEMSRKEVRDIIDARDYMKFDRAITGIAEMIAEMIKAREYEFKPIARRTIKQKNGKEREIGIESMSQQFCDYAAVYGMREMFYKKVGYSQFACIPGRGQFHGMKIVKKWLCNAKKTRYCLQCDVMKCYDNINHDILMRYLRRCIGNKDLLCLLEALISTHGEGLLIGSYLSPFLCNFIMSYAWHFMYEQHGDLFEHMATYIDDIILLGGNKRKLRRAFGILKRYLYETFGLRIKDNWRLYRVAYKDKDGHVHGQPIDFMGVRMTRYNTTVRKRIFSEIWKAVKKRERTGKIPKKLPSLFGWLKNTDCWRFRNDHSQALDFKIGDDYYVTAG